MTKIPFTIFIWIKVDAVGWGPKKELKSKEFSPQQKPLPKLGNPINIISIQQWRRASAASRRTSPSLDVTFSTSPASLARSPPYLTTRTPRRPLAPPFSMISLRWMGDSIPALEGTSPVLFWCRRMCGTSLRILLSCRSLGWSSLFLLMIVSCFWSLWPDCLLFLVEFFFLV